MDYFKYSQNIRESVYYDNKFTSLDNSTLEILHQQTKKTYCICGGPYDPKIFMIQCDRCDNWFHGDCVGIKEYRALDIDKYHCPRCQESYGPSIDKPIANSHRHDVWDVNASGKAVQTGSEVFVEELCKRHFASPAEIVTHMQGSQLTEELLKANGFDYPIIVDKPDELYMKMPPDQLDIATVVAYIGDREVDIIDVNRQTDFRMHISDLVQYYKSKVRKRVYNCISLEFSDTPLSEFVEAPQIVRDLDWVNVCWPDDPNDDAFSKRPRVQKYCLIGARNSFTDFHIDFGGTSVWYHVLRGEKIFYLIRPTPANLTLYHRWITSTTQSETFFGDQVDKCYKCTVSKGQTMFIPTGWIHAVFTPVDSLVFGGNFLHSLNIRMQLQIYDIEKKIKTPPKFLFPLFETINWYAAKTLMLELRQLNLQEKKCPNYLLSGLKALLSYLKTWNVDKDISSNNREMIPDTINSHKLLKDLNKEIRHAERFIMTLNPPKPERESKRKKRKPVNKDFVDYSQPQKLQYFATTNYTPPTEQATASHQGGTVMRFSLGPQNMASVGPLVQEQVQVPQPFNTKRSVYDFEDGSTHSSDEFNMVIAENYNSKKRSKTAHIQAEFNLVSIVNNPNVTNNFDSTFANTGIESLLKASAFTNNMETQEAIAGMLSIGQTTSSGDASISTFKPGTSTAKTKRRRAEPMPADEIAENISNVHQDDEYIYPALDVSDDEDSHIFKPRGRTKVDEAWNPKARVGPLLPKMNRPAREGTKKQAVEKVLEAAAARNTTTNPVPELNETPKRTYKKKSRANSSQKSKTLNASSSYNLSAKVQKSPITPKIDKNPKGRKGFKTVKQRLGKILKIHKMIR
ncbi:lysine-specific demethylase 7B-like [Chrysoperla carnea]|uniref:lysine-specific demethylase 7B-like n=1 Tax=Chrysoperla carnea TaxID=189513 RepID=UPI001D0942C9|nr:lysine-specific demethylase 7B-like [Chrysoperla carnea]